MLVALISSEKNESPKFLGEYKTAKCNYLIRKWHKAN